MRVRDSQSRCIAGGGVLGFDVGCMRHLAGIYRIDKLYLKSRLVHVAFRHCWRGGGGGGGGGRR